MIPCREMMSFLDHHLPGPLRRIDFRSCKLDFGPEQCEASQVFLAFLTKHGLEAAGLRAAELVNADLNSNERLGISRVYEMIGFSMEFDLDMGVRRWDLNDIVFLRE